MAKPPLKVSELLDELLKTIEVRGEKATVALLKNGRNNFWEDGYIRFVFETVCDCMQLTGTELYDGTTADGDTIKYAKGFIVYYLREKKITWNDISICLKQKDQSWLFRLMKMIRELKTYLSSDAEWISIKNKLDQIIKKYKS